MKTMKQLLLISLLFFSSLAKAQDTFLPDEIWYDTGKNIYIQFCLPSIYTLDHYVDASRTFQPLLYEGPMQKQIQNYDRSKKISISLDRKSMVTKITDCDNTAKGLIPSDLKPDSLFVYQELKLTTREGIKFNCYFKDLDEMLTFLKNDWGKSIQSITDEFKNLLFWDKRKAIFLHYRQNGDRIENTYKNWNLQVYHLDQIELKGGAGISFFKGKLMPNFEGQLGLLFSQKGILKNHYFAHYEIMYDFVSENNKMIPQSNHFIDLGYSRNFTKSPDKSNWYGVSVGYLISKKSAIFDDNTWRLSVHRKLSKNIELVPQIYFPNNFSKVFPGLKVNVSF